MQFGSMWPFFLLALVPVILLLYLLKQKAEDKTLSSLFLWQEAYKNIEATKPWEKLKNNLLMYLQILIVILLVLALAAPFLKRGGSGHQNVILAIDSSGSMNARYDDKQTRFERAVSEAASYIDQLRDGTSITILSMDKNAVIRGANVTDRPEAKQILSALTVTDHTGNPEQAVNFIASMAEQWEDYEAVFYTDSPIDLTTVNATLVSVNSVGVNGCIDYVSFGYDQQGMTALVKVSNPSPGQFVSDINLYIDDSMEDIRRVELAPGESTIIYFEGLKQEGEVIKAEINEKDHLLQDNVGYALIGASEVKKILLVSGQNVFLEKAMSLIPGTELYKTNQVSNIGENDNFDLYIFDGMVPEVLPADGNLIFLNPPGEVPGMFTKGEALENVMLTTASHEVTRYMDNFSFGVTKAQGFEQPVWAKTILKTGQYSVGFIGDFEGRKVAVLGFDLHNSDFPLQTEFPIFINNLAGQCLQRGMVTSKHLKTGDPLEVYPNPEGEDVRIISPYEETQVLPASGVIKSYEYLNYAGLYRLEQPVAEGVHTEHVIADFPTTEESVITEWSPENIEQAQIAGESVRGGREIRGLFLALLLVILLAEWIVYLKRI